MNQSFPKEVEARVREACNKHPQVVDQIYSFLVRTLGKEFVHEIPLLSKEDQVQACIDHLQIGVEVGDIRMKDIEALIAVS